jgi:hypothetical protein
MLARPPRYRACREQIRIVEAMNNSFSAGNQYYRHPVSSEGARVLKEGSGTDFTCWRALHSALIGSTRTMSVLATAKPKTFRRKQTRDNDR